MKQDEAKELLKKLQEDKYVDSKTLKKILTFSDKVLEKLNKINDAYLSDVCHVLTLYNNEKERLEIIKLFNVSPEEKLLSDIFSGELFDIYLDTKESDFLLAILKNPMLRDNELAIKHAKIFAENNNKSNRNILYKFLTDEFFIKNNLVSKFIDKINKLYNEYYLDIDYILNIIKEKYNDKYIDTYIKLLNEPNVFVAKYAYYFIMNNTFGNPKDNILMAKILPIFDDVLYRNEFAQLIINNKDLFVDVIRKNKNILQHTFPPQREFIYRFFKMASKNKFTKEDINKGIELIIKYYIDELYEEQKLMNILKNKKFKEMDELLNLEVSPNDILTIANLNSKIYDKIIIIIKNYPDYINVTLKCVQELFKNYDLKEDANLEYVINIILKYVKERDVQDFYNVIDIIENSYLRRDNLNIEYAELYINENNKLKRDLYQNIMTIPKYIEYREELINMLIPVNNETLLQILQKYMEIIDDEKELFNLFKILIGYNKVEELSYEKENQSVVTLADSIIEEYNKYELDKNAQDINNYLLNGLMGLKNKQFLKDNYDVIYKWLYEVVVTGEYGNIYEVKKVIQDKFNITIETEKEAHENKIELVNELINSMENKEEVNIRKLVKKSK